MEASELEGKLRKELIQMAKQSAEERGMTMPFGAKTNEQYKEMILNGEWLITKKTKRDGKKRVPLGSFRQKLVVPEYLKENGYVYRIVRGDSSRLQNAQDGGYEYVYDKDTETDEHFGSKTSIGSKVSYNVGKFEDGSTRTDYLMKIKKEFYDEDQLEKKKVVDEIDKAIHGGSINEQADDKRYIPEDGSGIQIDTNFG